MLNSIGKEERYFNLLKEKYEIIEQLSLTTHSHVYLIRHRILGVNRIAKVVNNSTPHCERVYNEAKVIMNMSHVGIPHIYDIWQGSDSICIIEEYINGKSLSEYIEDDLSDCISTGMIINIMLKLCEILEYLHHEGVLHLDIKPSNILIKSEDELKVYLIDYDSSVIINNDATDNNSVNNDYGNNYGTIEYAAPERFVNIADAGSDIYSVGMVLKYMLSKHLQSISPDSKKYAGWSFDLDSERISRQSINLESIMQRCIRHNRSQRFQSIEALHNELLQLNNDIGLANDTGDMNIYVFGTRSGIGVTHFCLCLSSFLAKQGRTICIKQTDLYDYKNTDLCNKLAETGVYVNGKINIFPFCNDTVVCDEECYRYRIYDCGVYDKAVYEKFASQAQKTATKYILIGDYGYREKDIRIMQEVDSEIIIFINHISGKQYYQYIKRNSNKHIIYRFPCIYDWKETCEQFESAVGEALSINLKRESNYFGIKLTGAKNFWLSNIKLHNIKLKKVRFKEWRLAKGKSRRSLLRSSYLKKAKLRVGVIGSSRGVGTTHLAIMVANYYANVCNMNTLLAECNDHRDFMRISKRKRDLQHFDEFVYKRIRFISRTKHKSIWEIMENDYEVIVCDMDNSEENMSAISSFDVIIVMGGLSDWKLEQLLSTMDRLKKVSFNVGIYNEDKQAISRHFSGLDKSKVRIINVPSETDPFVLHAKNVAIIRDILNEN